MFVLSYFDEAEPQFHPTQDKELFDANVKTPITLLSSAFPQAMSISKKNKGYRFYSVALDLMNHNHLSRSYALFFAVESFMFKTILGLSAKNDLSGYIVSSKSCTPSMITLRCMSKE